VKGERGDMTNQTPLATYLQLVRIEKLLRMPLDDISD
jgi:hypothetical protein